MSSIVIKGNTSGQIEIAAPDVAGSTTLTLPTNTGNIVTTGDSGTVTQGMIGSGVTSTGPAFRAYTTASQSVNGNTATKIQFNAETFDTNSCFDTSVYRFTPTVAGYYQMNACVYFQGSAGQYTVIQPFKNGSLYSSVNTQRSNGNYNAAYWNDVMYMNGSTDYVEIYGFDSATCSTVAGTTASYFSSALVRAA